MDGRRDFKITEFDSSQFQQTVMNNTLKELFKKCKIVHAHRVICLPSAVHAPLDYLWVE